MKYINLFEAFESEKLSKTLKYIESGDKQKVLSILRRLCEKIDFPFSQLSDDYIEYSSFRKALWKNDMIGDQPCEATSEREFPGSEVAGEKCTNGKIKRLWGGRPREVACPLCGGTGVKLKKQELKLLKFWFNKDGKFITTTAVDGIIRNNMKSVKTLSRNLSDFDILPKRLTLREIKNSPKEIVDTINFIEKISYDNCKYISSHYDGGLSNVWGGVLSDIKNYNLEKFPFSYNTINNLYKKFRVLEKIIFNKNFNMSNTKNNSKEDITWIKLNQNKTFFRK
jgi:hypothetical protein